MIDTIANFLTYLFEFSPTREFNYQAAFWAIIGLTIALAIGLMIKSKQSQDKILKKLINKHPSKLITLALALGINIFSRINRIDLLSMRFLTYTLSIWLLFSFYQLYSDLFRKYPKLLQQKPKLEQNTVKYKILKNKRPKHRQR